MIAATSACAARRRLLPAGQQSPAGGAALPAVGNWPRPAGMPGNDRMLVQECKCGLTCSAYRSCEEPLL